MTKLIDTRATNPKVKKTQQKENTFFDKPVRMASLSMHPDPLICAGSKSAGCMPACLKGAGLAAVYDSVNKARQQKTDFWHADQSSFLTQLTRELSNFKKNPFVPYVTDGAVFGFHIPVVASVCPKDVGVNCNPSIKLT